MTGLALGFNGPDGIEFDLSKLGGMPGSGGKGGIFDFAGSGGLESEFEIADEINKLLPEMGAEPISLEEAIKLLLWMAANQHKEWTLLIDFLLEEAAALITEAREAMADGK